MKIKNHALCLFIAFALSACSSSFTVRTDYQLEKFDDLIATNGSTMGKQPRKKDGVLVIDYSVLVKNEASEKAYAIALKEANLTANGETFFASCVSYSSKSAALVSLAPQKTVRIDCDIQLKADEKNKLALKDTEAWLAIPYSAPEVQGALKYKYKLKIEDFE